MSASLPNESPSSPYTPLSEDVSNPSPRAYADLRLLSFDGRVGRLRYVNWSVLSVVPALVVAVLSEMLLPTDHWLTSLVSSLAMMAYAAVSLLFTAKRLRDFGASGWIAWLQLVPVVNTVFLLVVTFFPGNAQANRYGAVPPPNTRSVACTFGLAIGAFLLVFYYLFSGQLDWLIELR